jgi:uncharacterized protein with FMN-binding domain
MKKILLSTTVIVLFAIYAIFQRIGNLTDADAAIIPNQTASQIVLNTPVPAAAGTGGRYKDGEYTGIVADAFYGNVQVKAVISGGKITDVQFLDYPQDRRTSVEINSQAMPILKSEVIQSQTAQVDGVSGASQTSRAFRESLQNALSQAKS